MQWTRANEANAGLSKADGACPLHSGPPDLQHKED